MKVKVNIINTRCITVSEAVTMPSLMMMTSILSEESVARNRHTHTHRDTYRLGVLYLKLFQRKTLKTKTNSQNPSPDNTNNETKQERNTKEQTFNDLLFQE